jgi:uncharacterized membrane protein
MQARMTWRMAGAISGLGALVLLVLLLALRPMTMHGMMWGYGTNYPGGGWGWWGRMALGWLAMVGFWLAIIIAAVLLIRQSGDRQVAGVPRDDALLTLRRRYAAGEIDQATYLRMSRELREVADLQS